MKRELSAGAPRHDYQKAYTSLVTHYCNLFSFYRDYPFSSTQLSEEGERYTFMESESDKLLKSLRHQSDARYMYFFIQPQYPPDYSAFISKPSEFALLLLDGFSGRDHVSIFALN